MKNKPIGILGGTFDPVHLGHIHLALEVYKQCNLQKVILSPCQQSPLRSSPIASAHDRWEMVKLAVAEHPQLTADDREIKNSGVSYMVNALQSWRRVFDQQPLCLIMGIDAFATFDQWYEWQEIPKLVHLIIANRHQAPKIENASLLELINKYQVENVQDLTRKPHGSVFFVDIHPLPIAATQIREAIKAHHNVTNLLPKTVWSYILKKGLYS
jgi:nicotinate-nucleotide adenylyltransferase